MYALLRTIAFGFIGYISPRLAIALGVPLDQWAVDAANYITASKAAITRDQAELGVAVILASLCATAELWLPGIYRKVVKGKPRRRVKLLLPILASVVSGFAFAGSLIWLYREREANFTSHSGVATSRPRPAQKTAQASIEMPSLLSLFMSDFAGKGSGGLWIAWHGYSDVTLPDQTQIRVLYQVLEDHHSMSKFMALFVPPSPKTFEVCDYLSKNYKVYFELPLGARSGSAHSLSETDSKNLTFTGRIFLYFETHMPVSQLGRLEETFQQNGARVEFRGTPYSLDVFNSIRAGDVKPSPKFELKDGLPIKLTRGESEPPVAPVKP